MSFFEVVKTTQNKLEFCEPEFIHDDNDDLLIKGGLPYAVWNERKNVWECGTNSIIKVIDKATEEKAKKEDVYPKLLRKNSSGLLKKFKEYCKLCDDTDTFLDGKIKFHSDTIEKNEYCTKRLKYDLNDEEPVSYLELFNTLYDPEELQKLEWAVGSIFCGDSTWIQKMIVLFGEPGSGKSTYLNVIEAIFEGYHTAFQSKSVVSANNQFSLSAFKDNPLVAIDQDGDLSRIYDNTVLNQIVSHDKMLVNEKYKLPYPVKFRSMLFVASNSPVKITDSRSGMLRRVIDVEPSGRKVPEQRYRELVRQMKYEYGSIANRCINVYKQLGPYAYSSYIPYRMLWRTYPVFMFANEKCDMLFENDPISLNDLYLFYKSWSEASGEEHPLSKMKFKDQISDYYSNYGTINEEKQMFSGFLYEKVDMDAPKPWMKKNELPIIEDLPEWLQLKEGIESKLDKEFKEKKFLAQYTKDDGSPKDYWSNVTTTLEDIDSSKEHYILVPNTYVVIDFDKKDKDNKKDLKANLLAAKTFKQTYAETSKSGGGLHLQYIYDGDPNELSDHIEKDVEIKVYNGNAALRRKLILCNDCDIAILHTGDLPLKERKEKKVLEDYIVKNEDHLRAKIQRYLHKGPTEHTIVNVGLIDSTLKDAYNSGLVYDVSDMRQKVINFAANSTNSAEKGIRMCYKMKWASEIDHISIEKETDKPVVIFDIECACNHWCLCYKLFLKPEDRHQLLDPTPGVVRKLFENYNMIGFNNLNYDNYICYAAGWEGRSISELKRLSDRIIAGEHDKNWKAEAISYADAFEFISTVQSLKKWEIELNLKHDEFELGWDKPIPDNMIQRWMDYCSNDVDATEAVIIKNIDDFNTKKLVAKISGLPVNNRIIRHAAKIIFGDDKNPTDKFNYPDLSKEFPGYNFEMKQVAGKWIKTSTYMDAIIGEGGYVYAEPGYYKNVRVYDVASMHPSSIIAMEMFGPYTKRYEDLKELRLAIKHDDVQKAAEMFDGAFKEYIKTPEERKNTAAALKLIINKVYGFTSASWKSEFQDPERNKDNKVAKRGALFMRQLLLEIQEMGAKAVHVKTDSIKIVEPSEEIDKYIYKRGLEYGYVFEVEDEFEELCLVNGSTYIAKDYDGVWHAKAKEFQQPYIFKKLFTNEEIVLDDYSIICSVKSPYEIHSIHNGQNYFIGRVGCFVPVKPEHRASYELMRYNSSTKTMSGYVQGTKGYKFVEKEHMCACDVYLEDLDDSYWEEKCVASANKLYKYGLRTEGILKYATEKDTSPPEKEHPFCELECSCCDQYIENSDGSRWCKLYGTWL